MQGSVYRPTYKDRKGTKRKSAVYWLRVSVNGNVVREPTGTRDEAEAREVLERRRRELLPRATLAVLERLFLDDYAFNDYRSMKRARVLMWHLVDFFGRNCTTFDVPSFIQTRLKEGASRATVNRETASLRRAFKLAELRGYHVNPPHIPKLRENNIRTGFVEREQLERILQNLPARFRPVIRVAFITGWRTHSELLPMRWSQVDFECGWIRLEPGSTKNREGREFPLIPELRSLLEAQRNGSRWLFPGRNGNHVQSFRKSWARATKAAGLPGLHVHDLRRSAARNMIRAGISPIVVMKLCGWKSMAMLQRYSIIDTALLEEAGVKLSRMLGG